MRRTLTTLLLATLYVLAVSIALKILPYDFAPQMFKALFPRAAQANTIWMKLREMAVVCVIAIAIAALVIREDKEKAMKTATAIGIFSLVWGIVLRISVVGVGYWSWLEVSDYLTTALAVPVAASIMWKFRSAKDSTQ
jgi:hypothetical protein